MGNVGKRSKVSVPDFAVVLMLEMSFYKDVRSVSVTSLGRLCPGVLAEVADFLVVGRAQNLGLLQGVEGWS